MRYTTTHPSADASMRPSRNRRQFIAKVVIWIVDAHWRPSHTALKVTRSRLIVVDLPVADETTLWIVKVLRCVVFIEKIRHRTNCVSQADSRCIAKRFVVDDLVTIWTTALSIAR